MKIQILKDRQGFTMIELLMVILIVSLLSAVAVPQFLNFQQEAKIAALKGSLAAMRSGIENQKMQVRLRCDSSTVGSLSNNIADNDITSGSSPCTAAEIPNVASRKFWSHSKDTICTHPGFPGHTFTFKGPSNPFVTDSSNCSTMPGVSLFLIDAAGGRCAYVDSFSYDAHWISIEETNEIFPGTNTPGVNECDF